MGVRSIGIGAMGIAVLLLAVGCSATEDQVPANLLGYNHTDRNIARFTVDGHGVASVRPHSTSGFVCCVSVPHQWRQGLTVKVKWDDGEMSAGARDYVSHEKVVFVPKYNENDTGGQFAVHFFPGEDVKVLVTRHFPGHDRYPYPSPSGTKK
ncbi:DUF3304 domain-containing protein [Cupriavidus gilardii]|uniref:DUF3304 domain-containing protein n=1 Tax=Cupriavidus gilardii TaxID=82541 RepID=UPI001ABDF841|nr:DUF3304 domain-containing protein [Cupriavidus gilardii]MBO4120784.1 DUF3304 domain-containing protein [Cupriavidus gilardii]